ncbi:DUF882 domain-containing protein [Flavisphingomonas formosensis]|uniref:DUF882 domain-containing protein n=1 Tax=Flavisphingomonas formosensis TaxID=861534 RepID=UPI0012FC2647|nr:DUF882 domain-containing protein [Sphingomonas formosensis]
MNATSLDRRTLVKAMLATGTGLLVAPGSLLAAMPERRLAFRNVHTNEKIDARYFGAGGFDPQGLAEINHGLRDWRNGETTPIDRDLLDLLVRVRQRLGVAPRRSFDLISGYRSPETNAALREAGGATTGVATKSQHMLGKATDVALPGVPLERLRLAALSTQGGGVGFYPRDGFVHIDTGRVRSW